MIMSDVVLRTGFLKKTKSGENVFFSYFDKNKIFSDLKSFERKNYEIIELSFIDFSPAKDLETLRILDVLEEFSPGFFFIIHCSEIPGSTRILKKISGIFSCLILEISEKNPEKLVDRKEIKKKVLKLDEYGITFSFKCISFSGLEPEQRDFFNFLFSLRPNSLEFPPDKADDLQISLDVDFFYNEGRAVSWFEILVSFLKITPFDFFVEFDSFRDKNGLVSTPIKHRDIEKIQILFLTELLHKRKLETYFPCIENLVLLNGAYSRAYGEGDETIIELNWNPQDIFGEDITNIKKFCTEVCREKGRYRVCNREGEVVFEPLG